MIQAQFIYVLQADGYGRLVLNGEGDNTLPDGFDEQRVSIKRSPSFYGLFREFTTSLKFVKAGKDYVQNIYEKEGTEFTINIGIYEYQPLPIDKYYLYFAGLIDLSTYTFFETSIECDINESSLARKIMSRDDVKVNLGSLETVEGETMPANQEVIVNLHEREIKRIANYIQNPEFTSINSEISQAENGTVFPFDLEASDIENLPKEVYGDINTESSLFYPKQPVTSKITISGILKGEFISGFDETVTVRVILRKYSDDLLTPALATDAVLFAATGNYQTVGESFDLDLSAFGLGFLLDSIGTNESLALITTSTGNLYTLRNIECSLDIEQDQLFDTTQASGYLMHEVADRITNTIADKQCFYSDFFGRVDLNYAVDGNGALTTVHSGKQIRAIPEEKPSLNLKDWFKSVNSIWSLGLGIEYNSVAQPFIRVEDKAHFFNGEVISTIHSVKDIKKEVAREWIYNEVEAGYAKAEYEEVNGLEEYNNKFEWATRINTIKNKLDLVSKLRADGYGIEFARRLQFAENPTEDSKYDNENFVIVVKPDGQNYRSAKNEDYDIVENIFSPESAYNLDITPGRMLRNNGATIRAGVEKYLTDPIKFRFAEQKANLKSQKTGFSSITENEDIDASTLNSPLWVPEIYSFQSILTREQLASISRNPSGIIKFSTTTQENTTKYYYGWILSIEAEDTTATWELLRVNTSSPDVVIVDPEGSTPEQPPIIVEPSTTFGIFEGPFEFVFVA